MRLDTSTLSNAVYIFMRLSENVIPLQSRQTRRAWTDQATIYIKRPRRGVIHMSRSCQEAASVVPTYELTDRNPSVLLYRHEERTVRWI